MKCREGWVDDGSGAESRFEGNRGAADGRTATSSALPHGSRRVWGAACIAAATPRMCCRCRVATDAARLVPL